MTVAGYDIGPIGCRAAFVADFDVASDIPLQHLVSKVDTDRRRMDVRRGMHHKYVPLRFDPATGDGQSFARSIAAP